MTMPDMNDKTVTAQSTTSRFVLRPVFDDTIAKIQSVAIALFGMTVVTLVLGVLIYLLLSLIGLGGIIRPGWVFGLLLLASLIVLPALFYELKRKAYAQTFYDFHDDYLEYQHFKYFVTRQRGRISYGSVSDATQKSNLLQEQKHLTTITLYIPDIVDQARGFPGLKLTDLPRTQDYLGNIIALIEDHNRRVAAARIVVPVVQEEVVVETLPEPTPIPE